MQSWGHTTESWFYPIKSSWMGGAECRLVWPCSTPVTPLDFIRQSDSPVLCSKADKDWNVLTPHGSSSDRHEEEQKKGKYLLFFKMRLVMSFCVFICPYYKEISFHLHCYKAFPIVLTLSFVELKSSLAAILSNKRTRVIFTLQHSTIPPSCHGNQRQIWQA